MKSLNPSRVVAVLTPLIAAGAAVGTPWLVKLTGLAVTPAEVTALAVTGAGSVVGVAIKWLDGHAKWERDILYLAKPVETVAADADKVDPSIVSKIEEAVKAEVAKLGPKAVEAIGAPADAWPAAEQVAAQVVAAAEAPAAPVAPVAQAAS